MTFAVRTSQTASASTTAGRAIILLADGVMPSDDVDLRPSEEQRSGQYPVTFGTKAEPGRCKARSEAEPGRCKASSGVSRCGNLSFRSCGLELGQYPEIKPCGLVHSGQHPATLDHLGHTTICIQRPSQQLSGVFQLPLEAFNARRESKQ